MWLKFCSAVDRPGLDARKRWGLVAGPVVALMAASCSGRIQLMTAKELLLKEAPQWTDAHPEGHRQATAALRVVASQSELAAYLDEESKLSAEEPDGREDRWALANAREAIREEPS